MESAALQFPAGQGTDGVMVDPEIVRQIRSLVAFAWGSRRIGRELGVARGTVRRYLRGGDAAETQQRPSRHVLDQYRYRRSHARHSGNLSPQNGQSQMTRSTRRRTPPPQSELARRAGLSQPAVARLEDPDYNPTLDMLERVAMALGTRLEVDLKVA